MEDNQMLKIIIEILKKEKIEIINLANEKENGCLLSFLYKGYKIYITSDGKLILDDNLGLENINYIKKMIVYAQKKANINKKLPIFNIDVDKLENIYIDNILYKKIMEIKNHCFLYRENGIFGIKYLLCEKIRKGKGYYYKNKKTYYNMQVAEQYFAKRINFMIKPLNMFTNNELKTILFYIDTFKNNGLSSKELKDTTENIKKTIIEILKGEEIEK